MNISAEGTDIICYHAVSRSKMGLDSVELVLDIEETFEIVLSDEEAEKALTPGILTDIVFSKVNNSCSALSCRSQSATWSREEVFLKIRKITSEHLGIDESDILETSLFVQDLGID